MESIRLCRDAPTAKLCDNPGGDSGAGYVGENKRTQFSMPTVGSPNGGFGVANKRLVYLAPGDSKILGDSYVGCVRSDANADR
jgi:hypothetical protein